MKKIGRYRLIEQLKNTTMAETWLAEADQVKVVIKCLHPHLRKDPVIATRFKREVLISQKLNHPGIIRIFDLIEDEQNLCLVMEYLSGGFLGQKEKPSTDKIIQWAKEITEAMEYAHQKGIIHRNLKPENILIDGEGHAVLSDFGSAHVQNMLGLTTSTMFFGIPEYTAPETAFSPLPDPRSDLYALGAVLYRLATGKAHQEPSLTNFFKPTIEQINPCTLNPLLPEWMGSLILLLLSDLNKRPGSAGELLILLEQEKSKPHKTKICLYCFKDIPFDAPYCLYCNKQDISINRQRGFERYSVVLESVSEAIDPIHHLTMVLQALKNDRSFRPEFLTGNTRMYSKEEKRAMIPFPARIIDNLTEESADAITALFNPPSFKTTIKITIIKTDKVLKKADKNKKTYKKPSLIPQYEPWSLILPEIPDRIQGSKKSQDFLYDLRKKLPVNPEMETESLSETAIFDAYRLFQSIENQSETLLEIARPLILELNTKYLALTSQLEEQSKILKSISLGEIYSNIQQIDLQIEKAESGSDTKSLIDQKLKLEQIYEKAIKAQNRYTVLLSRQGSYRKRISLLGETLISKSDPDDFKTALQEIESYLKN